jgi:FkbM family methyltransferase
LALAYYLRRGGEPTFVQIGACDGESGDPVHRFVKTGKLRAFVIEPIEESFVRLRMAYSGISNVTAIKAAIGHADGDLTLFKVKEGGRSVDSYWSRQLASFDRAHLVRHGVIDEEIEAVSVPCLTLQSLMKKYGIGAIDVLQVDTEGFDAEVVTMALELPQPPDCIYFENVHLNPIVMDKLFGKLSERGYRWTHDKWNTLAVNKRLIDFWAGLQPTGGPQ